MSVIRPMLASMIDYAGLFPPAGLDMEATVRNYASYRRGEHAWALGRLVIPASRLAEFESKAEAHLDAADPWPLAALGGNDPEADLKAISTARSRRMHFRIESLEIKSTTPEEIRRATGVIGKEAAVVHEIPIAEDPSKLIEALHASGGVAKIRTGGTRPGQVPSSDDLARFLRLNRAHVPYKATAGLHHALRSVRPLTYETGCESDLMHGFLNLIVSSAFSLLEMDVYVPSILEERDIRGFAFGESSLSWHGHEVSAPEVWMTRKNFFTSFGSCSFDEPMAELKELKLL